MHLLPSPQCPSTMTPTVSFYLSFACNSNIILYIIHVTSSHLSASASRWWIMTHTAQEMGMIFSTTHLSLLGLPTPSSVWNQAVTCQPGLSPLSKFRLQLRDSSILYNSIRYGIRKLNFAALASKHGLITYTFAEIIANKVKFPDGWRSTEQEELKANRLSAEKNQNGSKNKTQDSGVSIHVVHDHDRDSWFIFPLSIEYRLSQESRTHCTMHGDRVTCPSSNMHAPKTT